MIEDLTAHVMARGDLAHLALFLWAATATLIGLVLVRELALSNQRFSDFVSEVARLNRYLAELGTLARASGRGWNPSGQPVRFRSIPGCAK